MMQRAPLRETHIDGTNMPDQRSTKHTPDKTTDKAAVTVAAKLLDSAKKSQTKRLAKKMKLSLQKSAGSAGGKKQTARTLALCTTNDLNDTVEFKDSMPVRNVAKPPHASRKRKVAQQPQQAPEKKSLKRDREDAQTSAVSDCSSEAVQNTTADGRNANNLLTREVETAEAIDTDESSAPHTSSHCDKDTSQCDQDLSTSLHTCPTCGETMPQRKLVLHRTQCLRKQFGRCKAESAASNDDDKPCTDREHHTGDSDKQNHGEGKASTADYFFCQLCQKDLSHMNSHRRTLHINHCIDQEEKRKKTEEERQQALEAAKIQVLECPMCGKVLRTALGRKNHLKKCASSLGVQPDQLLAAVKRQEEEHQATLAAGILPTSYRPGRQKVTSTHRGMAALPKSKLDEDTQLALAISSSLRPDTDSDAGPSTSENAAPANRRGRKNKQEDDYLLVKLTESQAADRIATRVSDLLMQQQEEEVDEDLIPPLPAVSRDLLRVRGDRKQTLQWTADETDADVKMFWRRACLESQSSITGEVDSDPSMEFYVGALMPPVELSRVVAGSKIRRMSEIPGRMGSQQVKMLSEAMEECSEQVTEEMEESSDEVSEDRPAPSTQTAALLADMAAEADGMNAATRLSSACLQTSAVDVERQVQQDLQSDYSSLVNQQEFSDVVIHAAGATTLYAHRVILSVRCPALLKMSAEGSGIVDLSDCSPQSVVSLLNFVYAGVTEVDDRWIQHTLKLADRFGLTGFAEICRNQLPVPASQHLSRQHSGDTTENYLTAHSLSSPVSAREEDKMSTADSNFAAHSLSSPASAREEDKMSTADTINTSASVKDKDQTSSPDSITIQRHDLKDRVENNTTSNTISAPASEKEVNKIDSSDSIRTHGHYPGDVAENDIPVCSFTAPVGAKEEDKMSLTDSISIHSECESVDAESEIQQNSTDARQRRKEQEEVALQSDSGHSEKGEAHRITDYAQHSEMDDRTQQADDADMTEKLTKSPVNMTESPIEIRESSAKMRESRLETRESLLNSDSTSTSEQKGFNHKQNKPNLERKLKRGDKTKVDFGDQEKEALNSATRDSSCPVGGALSTEKEASNTEADQAKDFFSAELERDLGEKIQTVCRMVDEEGDIQAVNTTSCNLLAGKTAQSAESMNGSFSEDDDVHLLDVSLPSESRTQLFSTKVIAGEDHVRRKAVHQADEMTAGHAIDPVDSIEISDDDLFSSDEIDISLLPSTPQHSRQIHASQKPNLEERSETCGSTAEVEEDPPTLEPQALTKTVLVQDGQQTEDSVTNSSGEVRRGGRDEVKDTFIVPSPTARPHMTRQGQPAPGFEDSVSCFSLSAVESSYRAPSLSSPNVTSCFKTSTPQAGANSQSAGRTVSRTETGLASDKRNWFECGEQSVTDLTVISRADADRPELMPAHSKELTIVSDFRSPATTNVSSSTVICEATGTPRVSVVERDSLYITPVVEQGRIRRTFQLVTPASQHQGASLSPTTPTSHAAVGLNMSPEVRVGNRLEREFRSQQCDSAGDSSPASAGMHVEFGGISEGKMDSDSDLEIIDTSLQDPPSPKFSLASKPSSSQSQTGAQPSNQHSPDPQPLTLSRSNSTPVMSSQSKTKPSSQTESRGKSRSGNQGIGEASTASRSCDKDTARTNPGTPVSGLSQRSADSDRDLVRAVEIVSQQLAAAVTETGPVHLADCEKSDLASPVEADVWEGFDNLDIYNPDLDLIGHDTAPNPNSVTSPTDTTKTEVFETVISPAGTISRSGMKSTSACTTAESAALSFKTPMKLPLTILAESPESSPESFPETSESSPQTADCDAREQSKDTNTVLPDGDAVELSPFNHKVSQRRKYNETPCDRSSTPVRFRSLSKSPPSSRMTGEQREATEKRNPSHLEEPQSPGGFFVPEDDDAAADSSFLWCEENAPVEDDGMGQDDSMRAGEEGVLVLGREEVVLSLDSERPVLTPTMLQQRKKKGGKSAWVPPSPFTPMPSYDNMNTPVLKQEVQKYGLKAVGKKRMRLILTDIYHKTHQYETDSDCEAGDTGPANLGPPVLTKLTGPDDRDPSKQPPVLHKHSAQAKLKNTTGPPPRLQKQPKKRRKKQDEERQPPCLLREADESEDLPPVLQKETEKSVAKRGPKTKRGLARDPAEPMNTQSKKKGKLAPKTLPPQDDAGDFPAHPLQLSPAKRKGGGRTARVVSPVKSASDCYSSPEKGSFSSSQDSDVSGCPDVSVLERAGADSDDDDDITPSQQSTQDLPQKLMEFFKTQPGLYHKVLTYEPLDMAVLKCSLKECGLRCPQDKLRKFLDEKCITFTTKNMVPRKRKNHTRKHPRKKSAASQK